MSLNIVFIKKINGLLWVRVLQRSAIEMLRKLRLGAELNGKEYSRAVFVFCNDLRKVGPSGSANSVIIGYHVFFIDDMVDL